MLAIVAVNQTYVDDAKSENADGKLTEEQKKIALNKAKEIIISSLNNEQMDYIDKHLNTAFDVGFEAIIESCISSINDNKPDTPIDRTSKSTEDAIGFVTTTEKTSDTKVDDNASTESEN